MWLGRISCDVRQYYKEQHEHALYQAYMHRSHRQIHMHLIWQKYIEKATKLFHKHNLDVYVEVKNRTVLMKKIQNPNRKVATGVIAERDWGGYSLIFIAVLFDIIKE